MLLVDINSEEFDSYTREFTVIKFSLKIPAIKYWKFEAFGIGNDIVVFHQFVSDLEDSIVYLYDVKDKKWSNIDCDFTKKLYEPTCIKYYKQ